MNKRIVGGSLALAIFLLSYYAGIWLLNYLFGLPSVDPDLVIAVSDLARISGPVIGGYVIGRVFRQGMLAGVGLSFVGVVLIEAFGQPVWYYSHEYWQQIIVVFVAHYAIPAALAGGCGQLHVRSSSRVAINAH